MSAELQWELIRNHNSFMVRRSGVTFSTEPANLVKKHSFKYSGLIQPSVEVSIHPNGGVQLVRRRKTSSPTKVRESYTKPTVIKRTATGPNRVQGIANDMQSTGYRLDLIQATQAAVCAHLRSFKKRKNITKKLRANKLAKLTKKD